MRQGQDCFVDQPVQGLPYNPLQEQSPIIQETPEETASPKKTRSISLLQLEEGRAGGSNSDLSNFGPAALISIRREDIQFERQVAVSSE